jgi:hypothetical protein
MDFLNHRQWGYGLLSGFPPFSLKCTLEKCKRMREFEAKRERLRKFEEIEISRQSCKGDCE